MSYRWTLGNLVPWKTVSIIMLAHSNFVAPRLFFIYRALWVTISQNFFCILHSIFECMGCRLSSTCLTFTGIYIFFSPRLQQMCYIIFKRKSYLGNRSWVCMIAKGGVVRKSQIFHIKSYILIFNMGKGTSGFGCCIQSRLC